MRVESELGDEFEVYIKDAPSAKVQKQIRLRPRQLNDSRFIRTVRRNWRMKSYSSSRQFCSISNVVILSDCG